nr:cytochrome P450 82A3-like [Ipomoea batatas]
MCNNITFSTLASTFVLLFFLYNLFLANHKRHAHNANPQPPELPGALPIIESAISTFSWAPKSLLT